MHLETQINCFEHHLAGVGSFNITQLKQIEFESRNAVQQIQLNQTHTHVELIQDEDCFKVVSFI